MAQWKQREIVPAKPGDKLYWIVGDWGKPEIITVTGECDEGHGYTANSPKFAAEHKDNPEYVDDPGAIHTCNGFICKTKREARAESLRIARKLRKEHAEQQAHHTQVVQYLDWVIARGGRH